MSQSELQYCDYITLEKTPHFQQVIIITDLNKYYSLGIFLANLLKHARKEQYIIRRKRKKEMKIALSAWKDYISTVFDTADQLLVLEIDEAESQKRTMVKLNPADVAGRANQIKELQIDVLICGAVARPLEASLISLGIRVHAFIRGPVEDVLAAYQNGSLDQAIYAMPGCLLRGCEGNRRQNRRRRGLAV